MLVKKMGEKLQWIGEMEKPMPEVDFEDAVGGLEAHRHHHSQNEGCSIHFGERFRGNSRLHKSGLWRPLSKHEE